ncbi:hypothetical protein EVG20_g4307 [Dentipellis fragilis]|uniref:Uncharacterized protein n=1 Tax=Dentipellis fragilis TaxID=205917 RepID=A0A4Y9YWJ5_9AGAM|nr:hypothetical protein EVG20_g4307 [Dentipellis fragilis]
MPDQDDVLTLARTERAGRGIQQHRAQRWACGCVGGWVETGEMEHRGREREGTRDGMGRMREPLSYVHRVPRAVTIPLAVVRRDRARAGRALARVPCILVRCRLVPEPNVHAAGRGLSMLAARSRTSACDSGDERSLSTAVLRGPAAGPADDYVVY